MRAQQEAFAGCKDAIMTSAANTSARALLSLVFLMPAWAAERVIPVIPKDAAQAEERSATGKRATVHVLNPEEPPVEGPWKFEGTFYPPGTRLILVDRQEAVRLGSKRFVTLSVSAGDHSFSCRKSEVNVVLKPGEERYFRCGGALAPGDREGAEELYGFKPVRKRDVYVPTCGLPEASRPVCRMP